MFIVVYGAFLPVPLGTSLWGSYQATAVPVNIGLSAKGDVWENLIQYEADLKNMIVQWVLIAYPLFKS